LNWLNVLGIAVALAMDAFAVSVAAGITIHRVTGRHVFRLAWHFGLFQFLMPVLGWLAGHAVADHLRAFDHWIAFALLGGIGGKMLLEAGRAGPGSQADKADPTRGLVLVTLSVATSIDALAVGLTLAVVGVSVWVPAVVIGLVAGLLTVVGIRFGDRIGSRLERWAGAAGGLVLIAIGVRILLVGLLWEG
jgi:putative Mn2+ efflux pump MntP